MIDMKVSVPLKDILDALCEHDEIKHVIIELDRMVADYDFTKELRDYFVEEIKKEDMLLNEE